MEPGCLVYNQTTSLRQEKDNGQKEETNSGNNKRITDRRHTEKYKQREQQQYDRHIQTASTATVWQTEVTQRNTNSEYSNSMTDRSHAEKYKQRKQNKKQQKGD